MGGFEERFAAGPLDTARWVASYLPAWSSRAAAAATYEIAADGLRLSIPPDHPHWCAGLHDDPPLRVSAVQSGNWSGPVGSTRGQQPFRAGLRVAEAQVELRGFVPLYGRVGRVPRSYWARLDVLCLADRHGGRTGAVRRDLPGGGLRRDRCRWHRRPRVGIHAFRDPKLTEEFTAAPVAIDVAEWHTYAVDWRRDGVDWYVDGGADPRIQSVPRLPDAVILGVFDFPRISDPTFVPELVVRRVSG